MPWWSLCVPYPSRPFLTPLLYSLLTVLRGRCLPGGRPGRIHHCACIRMLLRYHHHHHMHPRASCSERGSADAHPGILTGLAVSYMIPEQHRRGATGDGPRDKDEDSVYRSDFFSIIGTAFLWVSSEPPNCAASHADASHSREHSIYAMVDGRSLRGCARCFSPRSMQGLPMATHRCLHNRAATGRFDVVHPSAGTSGGEYCTRSRR